MLSIVPEADLPGAGVWMVKLSHHSPAPGGSSEMMVHGKGGCYVALLADDPGGRTTTAAVASFEDCLQSVFGYPNDEASRGDHRMDLGGYGFYEVVNSPWIDRLRAHNRLAFPHADWWPHSRYRHFLILCQENRAEILAESFSIRTFPDFSSARSTAWAWAKQGPASQ